jgi:hypothetical protein
MSANVLDIFFDNVITYLKNDAESKGQKAPVNRLRKEINPTEGQLIGPFYFKYIVTGRGPGKQPPPDAMLKFVQANPDILVSMKQRFKYITEKGAAYIIGRKIGREGTDIWQGKKEGIDLLGAIEANLPELNKMLVRNELQGIQTALKTSLK